jgi:acyl-CoA reductase-like NAD-dependent aldehyde dehydrogenase
VIGDIDSLPPRVVPANMTASALLQSKNPATGEVVGEVTLTPLDDIPRIVAAARAAQAAWRDLGAEGRMRVLGPVGARIVERAQDYARLISREMGKPLAEAVGEVLSCGKHLARELQSMVDALAPEPLEDEQVKSIIYRDPLGVCAAITPWNFPFSMPHWIVMPALMAGNAVVLKPSEETPLVGQAYADVLNEVLPPGVLQTVHGADDRGKALVNADVDLIAFTGSREAGKHILGAASKDLKRVILELGGKDPLIVLDDADLAAAASFAARNSFGNAGQVCVSTERIYVHEAVAAEFVAKLVESARSFTVGNGLDGGTRVGPLVNARQRDHVLEQVHDAVAAGAVVAYGGEARDGLFVTPTVLTGVTHAMGIAVDETFGPVACVTRVGSDDDAVALANDTRFGLGAVVFGSEARAAAVARRLNAGMIGINRGCRGAFGSPWVGAGQSGYGYHSSRDGHRQFAQTRVVSSSK